MTSGATITDVLPGGPADIAGLEPGDILLSIDGQPLRDIIDYRFGLEPGIQEFGLARGDSRLSVIVENAADADPGIDFAGVIFDGVRTCRCKCLFCFVEQLPEGLRRSLNLKDDDFRLSFLYGNFVTLNNLSEDDERRILHQRLSPLHVSFHSADAAVRARLMGCSPAEARKGIDVLRRLGGAGIEFHAQIVLCPEINDGRILADTVNALAEEYPGVASVGVVPVAVSSAWQAHTKKEGSDCPALRPIAADDCRSIVEQIEAWQQRYRAGRGIGFVYAADEFYLAGSLPLPAADAYDEFPQYENGIGIAVSFLQEGADKIRSALDGLDDKEFENGRVFLLSGTLARHIVAEVCRQLEEPNSREFLPLAVTNKVFGRHVTVTGLLGGADVIRCGREAGISSEDLLLLPSSVLDRRDSPRFLDDVTLAEAEQALGCRVLIV